MAQILRTVLAQDITVAAAASTQQYDLPVNPLSVILCTLKALNETSTVTAYSAFQAFFDKLTRARVSYRGASIIDGAPLDLVVIYAILTKWLPHQGQVNNTDNDTRSITFPLLFGRKPYDPAECFPASRRGELLLDLTFGADPAGMDTFILQLETVELLDAAPERFIKTTFSDRIMASGEGNDVEIPIGNKILGMLARAATFPTAASYNSSFGQIALEVDNVEVIYSRTNWETLQGEIARRLIPGWNFYQHSHQENTAVAYTQNASTLQTRNDNPPVQQYGYLDLDPMGDGSYALDTRGAARVNLAITSDVTDASASRVQFIEEVPTGAAAAA